MKYLMPAALLSALALTGCGGPSDNTTGGGSTSPAAVGIWSGTISVSPTRNMSMLVLKSGQLWMVYTKQGSSDVGGAMWANTASPNGSTYTATSPIDFNLSLGVAAPINLVSTSLVAGSKFWGSYNYTASPSTVYSFQTTAPSTTTAPAIVGTFAGTTGTKAGLSSSGSEALTLTINTGSSTIPNIVGTSASGCTVSGSILPLSGTAAYVVDLSFSGSGSACANGTGTSSQVAGVAFVDSVSGKLNILALNLPATTKGFVFRN
jgi:hypothetical protein